MEPKKIVVAGIGTDVGKTVISAILCEALNADYWKPVQAGDLDNTDSMKIKRLISNSKTIIHPESYRLKTPMSPHAAAKIDGIEIDQEKMSIPETKNDLVIELAGGLMVPLTKDFLNLDWIVKVGFPVVLVANYYLGSINHTLLSIEQLNTRNIPLIGLIFSGEKNQTSYDVIMHRANTRCLLELPWEEQVTSETISKHARRIEF